MSPYISGFLIFLIISLFLGAFFSLLYTDKLKLNDESLDKQPLFWFAVLSPIVLFLIFGVIIWKDYIPDLSKAGLDKFAEISKFPLAVLALSPIFGVIVSNIHKTIQTKKEIQVTEVKNISDSFYSHNKYIIEELKSISGNKEGFELELNIRFPNLLYKDVYKDSCVVSGASYKIDEKFTQDLNNKLSSLSKSIEELTDYLIQRKKTNDEFKIFFITCYLKTISNSYDALASQLHVNSRQHYLANEWNEICKKLDAFEKNDEGADIYAFIDDVHYFYNCVKVNNLLNFLFNSFDVTINFIDKVVDILGFIEQSEFNNFRKIAIYELSDLKNDWNFKCQEISYDYCEHRYEMQLAQERQGL
ncbi:TPA: hypothetical protein U2M34_000619 [Providencia rettgeri]|nr:hypothetical protein [Providencia rettgeri]